MTCVVLDASLVDAAIGMRTDPATLLRRLPPDVRACIACDDDDGVMHRALMIKQVVLSLPATQTLLMLRRGDDAASLYDRLKTQPRLADLCVQLRAELGDDDLMITRALRKASTLKDAVLEPQVSSKKMRADFVRQLANRDDRKNGRRR